MNGSYVTITDKGRLYVELLCIEHLVSFLAKAAGTPYVSLLDCRTGRDCLLDIVDTLCTFNLRPTLS